jgi:DNA polymerase-3 subunit delta'
VYWLDCNENKKNISIEQIRNLRKNLNKKSFSGLYKIAIIKNADKLSRSAGNSLLKILEEPPCKTYFFLLTNNMYNILETVKSRCQLIHFFIVPQDKIAKYLINEKGLIDKKAKRLAFLSRGHPGLAVDYYEDETALKNFEDKMDQCIYFIENDLDAKFAFIETLTSKKNHKGTANEINIFLNNLIIVIRDILMLRLIGDPVKQYDVYLNKKLKKIINKYDISKMLTLINLLQRTKSNIIFNGNVKLNLEYIALAL